MRHKASGSLVDLWRRTPPAIAGLLGEATENARPLRALLALMVVTSLMAGGYVAGRVVSDPSSDSTGSSAGSRAPYHDGRHVPPGRTPSSVGPIPGRHSAEPTGSATTQSQAASPPTGTTAATPTTPTAATTPTPTTPATLTSARAATTHSARPSGPGPTSAGSPSASAAAPSTTPSQTGTTVSAAPEDTTPPQSSVSEDFPARDAAVFILGANEPATFTCSLDGAAYTSCSSPHRYQGLAAGWHTLLVRATDTAGNTDPTPAVSRWHSDKGNGQR